MHGFSGLVSRSRAHVTGEDACEPGDRLVMGDLEGQPDQYRIDPPERVVVLVGRWFPLRSPFDKIFGQTSRLR
jgi:hypothetical protein